MSPLQQIGLVLLVVALLLAGALILRPAPKAKRLVDGVSAVHRVSFISPDGDGHSDVCFCQLGRDHDINGITWFDQEGRDPRD